MILQYKVCQTKHVLLLFSGIILGVSKNILVEGSVTGSTTTADPKSTFSTVTNGTNIYDLQRQNTSTVQPRGQAITEPIFVTSSTDSETPDNGIYNVSSTENSTQRHETPPSKQNTETTEIYHESFTENSTQRHETPPPKQNTETTGILIGCLVCVFFIIIISCLAFSLIKQRKKSYSLNYKKSPEASEIPLNTVKP